MGVIKRGILGGVSGRVGNIVGSSWKGIAYLKSLPLSVANPRTSGQVSARTAMSYITQNFSPFLTTLIQPLWNRWSVQMSGFNHFVQTNVRLFPDGQFDDFSFFKLAVGKLLPMEITSVVADKSLSNITFTVVNNSGEGNALASDIPFVMVYNANKDEWTGQEIDDNRAGGAFAIDMPSNWAVGDALKCYGVFRSVDGYLVSNTAYATCAIVA
jgi:hypothetical protein